MPIKNMRRSFVMSNINNIKDAQKLPMVTQKDLERAENKYNVEHFEEEIWENAVDDTKERKEI